MAGKIQRRIAAVVAVTALGLVGACGSSSSGTTGANDSPGAGTTVTADQLFKNTDTLSSLPAVKPAPAGTEVWVIPCGLSASGCANVAQGVVSVMKSELKWDVTLFDGKLTPATYIAGINQAIVAGAKAIVLVAVDCDTVKPSLQKAKAAGIPVIGLASFDCTGADADLMQTADIGGGPSGEWKFVGQQEADYVAYSTHGKGQVILLTEPDFQVVVDGVAAFKSELGSVCPGCKIVTEVPALSADLGNGAAATKVGSALVQHPDADVVVSPNDATVTLIQQALRTAGSKVPIVTFGAQSADLKFIKDGQLEATLALDNTYGGWAATDATARALAGKALADPPFGAVWIDKGHNLPSSDTYVAPFDYQKAYKTAWGMS